MKSREMPQVPSSLDNFENLIEEVRGTAVEMIEGRIKNWIPKAYGREVANEELSKINNATSKEIYCCVYHDYHPDPDRAGRITYDISPNLDFQYGVGYKTGDEYRGFHPKELSENLFKEIENEKNNGAVDELRRALECEAILEEIERIKRADVNQERKDQELKILTDALAERRLVSASAKGELKTLDNAIY